MEKNTLNSLAMPIAIVLAGALIGAAVLYTGNNKPAVPLTAEEIARAQTETAQAEAAKKLDLIAPVTADDHIRGSADAKVVIVEYSDFECPFCKRHHDTMIKLMGEYGTQGDVAWVFRHFPIESLHPEKAYKEAHATECAAEQGGNDVFWTFADRMIELSAGNNRTDLDVVFPKIVSELGLDAEAFQSCMDSNTYEQKINDMVQEAAATGGRGTPWNVVITADGTKYPINGAQPYASIKQIVELALNR